MLSEVHCWAMGYAHNAVLLFPELVSCTVDALFIPCIGLQDRRGHSEGIR